MRSPSRAFWLPGLTPALFLLLPSVFTTQAQTITAPILAVNGNVIALDPVAPSQPGSPVLYAYATDGEEASSNLTFQGGTQIATPLIGSIASHEFVVLSTDKIPETTSFTGAPPAAAYGSSFTVTATTNASVPATIAAAGACAVAGNLVTMTTGTGTCLLTASWPGDDTYLPASAAQSTVAAKAVTTTTIQNLTVVPNLIDQVLTFTATVTSPGGTVNEGKVGFVAYPINFLGVSAPVVNGVASFTAYVSVPFGPNSIFTIAANYGGGTNFSLSGGAAALTVIETYSLIFQSVTPCRLVDTRNPDGPLGGPKLAGGSARIFPLIQSACPGLSRAQAYALNVTVIPDGPLDYLTVWPTGQPQPPVSTLNSDGRIKANAAIVHIGDVGAISVYTTDSTHIVIDIVGIFVYSPGPGGGFVPVTPCRVADTRQGNPPLGGPSLGAGEARQFPVVSGNCNIPSSAQAYSLNITAVPHDALGYLTAWPTGQAQPLVSTLNAPTGAVTANAAIVPAGTNGDISIYVTDAADLVIDINGYFAPSTASGLSLSTLSPCRVLDTRSSSGQFNGTLALNVSGSACAPPSSAQAFVLNATVVPPGPLTYLTLWPDGQSQPLVSTLNALDGAITSNMAIMPTTNGMINAFASDSTQLILDISSFFYRP